MYIQIVYEIKDVLCYIYMICHFICDSLSAKNVVVKWQNVVVPKIIDLNETSLVYFCETCT